MLEGLVCVGESRPTTEEVSGAILSDWIIATQEWEESLYWILLIQETRESQIAYILKFTSC